MICSFMVHILTFAFVSSFFLSISCFRKGRCDCNRSRENYPRQRGGAVQQNYFQDNPPPIGRSHWSLDSRGSGSESPTSSVSSTHGDWYEYEVRLLLFIVTKSTFSISNYRYCLKTLIGTNLFCYCAGLTNLFYHS